MCSLALKPETFVIEQEVSVQVLGMKREDCYAIVALGMDVWGYGETAASATRNLQEHIHMQIAYLIHTNKVELIHRNAPAEFFDMYNECFVAGIKNEAVPGWWISTLSIPATKEQSKFSVISNRNTIHSPAARYAAGVCRRIAA